jgi:hypothetical protein
MREVAARVLPYDPPVSGTVIEVELTRGPKVRVFRAQDGHFYFRHGLTFGGKHAPGGPVSPFSGKDVRIILDHYYRAVIPALRPNWGWSPAFRRWALPTT